MVFQAWKTWVAGQPIPAADMNQDLRDNMNALFPQEEAGIAWSPDLQATGTSPASESVVGVQYKVGALQFVWARFTFSGGGGVGEYFVDLPQAAVGIAAASTSGTPIGVWSMSDTSAPANGENGTVTLYTSTTIRFRRDAGGISSRWLSDAVPAVIASGDVISFSAQYPYA